MLAVGDVDDLHRGGEVVGVAEPAHGAGDGGAGDGRLGEAGIGDFESGPFCKVARVQAAGEGEREEKGGSAFHRRACHAKPEGANGGKLLPILGGGARTNGMLRVRAFLLLISLGALTLRAAPANFAERYHELELNAAGLPPAERLQKLFALDWERTMVENPEAATSVGYPGQDDRWTDLSPEAVKARQEELRWPLAVVQKIDRAKLPAPDQLSYDLFKRKYERAIEGTAFPSDMLPLNQLGGVQIDVPQLFEQMPKSNAAQYRNILARLKALPELIDQNIVWLERGLAAGVTPPKVTLQRVPAQVLNLLPDDPAKSPLLASFAEMPAAIPEKEQAELRAEAMRLYQDEVAPAYRKLHDYLANEYVPKARETIGLSALPNGAKWYAFAAEESTTTKLTPPEIHDLGLREVARIRGEMAKVMAEVKFKGTQQEFGQTLRADPKFQYATAEELLTGYRDIAKRIDPGLPKLFKKLPRLTYGVKPIPDAAAESAPTAYYLPGAPDVGRAGYFFANVSNLPTRARWQMEALTLHEAVPGHHLQIALAQEMESGPEFRKNDAYTAYTEGWGLYAESLGSELGLYADPYSHFGELSFEVWRACRLVVDTGMHALGWSRQQAIDYMRENTVNSDHDIEVEVDRYIVWPGQALAYKIGELRIRELRERAQAALGDRFDIRGFHDTVLGSGAVPLDVLEQLVNDWVKRQLAQPKP